MNDVKFAGNEMSIFERIWTTVSNPRDYFENIRGETITWTLKKTIPWYLATAILITLAVGAIDLAKNEFYNSVVVAAAYFVALPLLMILAPLVAHGALIFILKERNGTIVDTYQAFIYTISYLYIFVSPIFLLLPFLIGNLIVMIPFILAAISIQIAFLIIICKGLSELHEISFGKAFMAFAITSVIFKITGFIVEKIAG